MKDLATRVYQGEDTRRKTERKIHLRGYGSDKYKDIVINEKTYKEICVDGECKHTKPALKKYVLHSKNKSYQVPALLGPWGGPD